MALFILRSATARLTKFSSQTGALLLNDGKRYQSTDDKPDRRMSDEGYEMVGIGRNRYVSVYSFGTPQVEIREYYYAPNGPLGKILPSKRGINMTMEQYEAFKKLIPEIDKKFKNPDKLVSVTPSNDPPKSRE